MRSLVFIIKERETDRKKDGRFNKWKKMFKKSDEEYLCKERKNDNSRQI